MLMTTTLDNHVRTVLSALTETEQVMTAASVPSPRLAAEWLVAGVLGCPRLAVFTRSDTALTEPEQVLLGAYTARAARHEPVQYILGETEFMGLRIGCDPRALIPRPETEVMTAMVVDDLRRSGSAHPAIVDVGTGTGCVALALAAALPQARVTALDVDASTLALARENGKQLELSDRVHFQQGDLLAGFDHASADVIVANLPYIATDEWATLSVGVRDFEPRRALDGGVSGLDYIERLAVQAFSVLVPEGRIYLEIGADQGPSAHALLEAAGFSPVSIHSDWTRRDRIVKGVKS